MVPGSGRANESLETGSIRFIETQSQNKKTGDHIKDVNRREIRSLNHNTPQREYFTKS